MIEFTFLEVLMLMIQLHPKNTLFVTISIFFKQRG